MKRCPKCKLDPLTTYKVRDHDVRIERCKKCQGMWLDKDELNAVANEAARELGVPREANKVGMLCTNCQEFLYEFKYPQIYVTVDMCKECGGLWLDAGEFEEIKAVRKHLKDVGKLDDFAPVTGAKGDLIRFISNAIETLSEI